MFLSVKIWSMQPLPLRKPTCSSLSNLSTDAAIRWIIILLKNLLGTESRVIPRQLLQSVFAPLLGISTATPLDQSSGITSRSHMSVNSGGNNTGYTLKSSTFKLSGPGALPFFKDLMALIISSLLGGSMSISRSDGASGMFASSCGCGLLMLCPM